jgi:hypothetical protein
MTIAEQIIEKVQQLSLDEQRKLLELLSNPAVQNGKEARQVELRKGDAVNGPACVGAKLVELAKRTQSMATELPADLAANHDHYLHGLPKRS